LAQNKLVDFVKHAPPKDFPKLSAIWRSIPSQLSRENRKFIISHVKESWRAKDLEDALEWLITYLAERPWIKV